MKAGPWRAGMGVLLLFLLVPVVHGQEAGLGLRAFVERAVAADLGLQAKAIGTALGAEQVRLARSAYRPKLVPYYSLTQPDASTRSENRGAVLRWDTGWGLELETEYQETQTRYLNDYLDFGAQDLHAGLRIPLGRRFGRLSAHLRLEAARLGAANQERELRDAEQQAILESARLYFDCLRAEKSREVARSGARRAERSSERVRMKYELGEASRLDLDRATQQLQSSELALIRAETELSRIRRTISSRYGIDPARQVRFQIPDLQRLRLALQPQEAVQKALSQDPAVLAARDQIQLAELELRWARRRLWPALDLALRAGERTEKIEGQAADPETYEEVYLTSDLSLDFAERRYALRSAMARLEMARLRLRRLEEQVRAQIRADLDAAAVRSEMMRLGRESLATARRQLEIAEMRFERGLGSAFDVVESQNQLQSSELADLDVQIETILQHYRLLYALGELTLERLPE